MRILFSVNNFGFLRNFEPALRLLATRGHALHLVAERKDSVGGTRTVDNLRRDYPELITHGYAPSRKDDPWQPLALQLRLALDYWRYLDRRYDASPSLRARAARQAPAFAVRLAAWPLLGSAAALRLWQRLVRWLERALPSGTSSEQLFRTHNPDVLLLTPLLYFGSRQVEYVRAARARGLRTVLGVGSWDHLTTKGLIHERPDHVIVWNEMQRTEAAELHGIPPEHVTVTGAQAYDHWFTQQPSRSREAFCARVGVPHDRPLLLYLCSSPFITPHEVGFVRRWIETVRTAADPALRQAAILIRPHPQNADQWKDFDPSSCDAVGVWPRAGANPVDSESRAEYFDSMYYSAAVVGVNTSALIESGIVGRPVYTVIADEFAGQQEGTLHFQHLKNVNGGLLHVGSTLQEHVAQLAGAVHGGSDSGKSRAFVEAFVRPRGLDRPAAEWFVQAIEALAAAPAPAPVRSSVSLRARRLLMRPLARAVRAAARRREQQRSSAATMATAPERPLRILFTVASPEFLRYYDTTMSALADRGHSVALAVNWLRERKHARLDLLGDERIEILGVVPKRQDLWTPFARAIRGTMDFVRYLDPRFANTPLLRDRMYRRVLPALFRPLDRIQSLSARTVARLLRLLQAFERAVPVSTRVRRFLEAHQPDVILVPPLVDAASDQVDTVRAAQALGIPVIAGVASWDNLTNKGHLRVAPDLVTVWNRHQKAEAVELHGIPPERVLITGAQLFDRWFERQPSVSRAEFCRAAGLPDDRPFVLFTGSSVFIARSEHEVPFVRRWIESLRGAADPMLRDVAILVRPHPFNADAWISADFSDLERVTIWPRGRYTPAAEAARASFFDSLYYCEAVVGINTSAMIEASILRKPVLSILTPEFAGTQEGTIHFRYLLPENGGFLRVAGSIEEHVGQLAAVLHDPALTRQETEQFVSTFLRPHGLTSPCTPILADAIVQTARTAVRAPRPERAGVRALRLGTRPLAFIVWMANLGGGVRRVGWKAVYESYDFVRRGTRLLHHRLVVRPARSVRRVAILGRRSIADASRALSHRVSVFGARLARAGRIVRHRAARATLRVLAVTGRRATRLPHAVVRRLRLARYHLALRLRGVDADEAGTRDV
jgi:hypothetical protein